MRSFGVVIVAAALLAPSGCVRAWETPGGDGPLPVDDRGPAEAAAPDQRGTDGLTDQGAPDLGPGCPPPRLLCDGFEQPLPGAWAFEGNGTTTRIDASQGPVRSGGYALRLAVPAGKGVRATALVFHPKTPLTGGQLYVRAHLYLASTVSTSNLSLMEVGCDDPALYKISFDSQDGKLALVNLLDPSGYVLTSADLPTGRWFCAELLVAVDSSNGSTAAGIDGVERASVSGIKTTCGGFDQATVQLWTDSQPAVELYVDDVVIATAPVGCQ